MRLLESASRTMMAAAVSAGAGLVVTSAPASAAAAGAVISVEAQADGWRGMSGGSVVEYWMAGSDGAPRRASGAMFVPAGVAPAAGWPIMAVDHGSTGLGAGCGGQSNPQGYPFPGAQAQEDKIIGRLLSKGFAVVAPDLLGLGRFDTGPHPYLETRTEATATIDLVRAAREARSDLSRTWGVVGVSQGGHAALGTGHLQAGYAPDLDFRGTIAADPASDVEKVLPVAGPAVPDLPGLDGVDGFVVSILAGMRAARPDLDIDSYLSPRGREVVDGANGKCLDTIIEEMDGIGVGDLLARPLSDDRFRAALADYMALPTNGYDAPILLLLNAADTVVPSPLHAALAAQFAANGVDFQAVPGVGGHGQLDSRMWAAIDAFLDRIQSTPTQR
ncbi:lipase family protein [Nocardia sp. NPDC050712]|uniref:lipase family protein n=1 Tax=Nocardia sp. NPDC050712 TaxID=3155518 RepID=UPI00340A1F28